MTTLCKPRYDFSYEKKNYRRLDGEPITVQLSFKRAENYAFTHEEVPIRPYINPLDELDEPITIHRICVFYPIKETKTFSERVRFSQEDFDKKFEILSYTDW